MRKFIAFFISVLLSSMVIAQTPQGINYQAVARNSDGSIVSGKSVIIRFTILDGSTSGTVVYQETHQAATNNFGLFTMAIGRGTVNSGNFSGISWGTGTKFLKVEIAIAGSVFSLQGITQMLSVPYALYAEKSGTPGAQGPAGPQGAPGANGPQGTTGTQGATGPIGPQGPAGSQGSVGLTGPAGPQGVAGVAGATGASGATGPQGVAGATGLQGPLGATGPAGPQGLAGLDGKTVLNGTINPAANTGTQGDFYMNVNTSRLFGPKTTAGWGNGVSLVGAAGGPPGLKSLIDMENYAATASCVSGGVRVKSGIDLNSNNVLDANEVDNTKEICFTQKAELDKVIIIPINFLNSGASSAGNVNDRGQIFKFNKNNYPGVDSIILVCNPYLDPNFQANTPSGVVQLFNITDNVPIANSQIITNYVRTSADRDTPVRETGNIINYLPNQTISLGILVQSSDLSLYCYPGLCYLYLYRK